MATGRVEAPPGQARNGRPPTREGTRLRGQEASGGGLNEPIRPNLASSRLLLEGRLPRYYFHTQNGDRIRDDQGEELADADAARNEALTVLGEILRYRGRAFWTTGLFSVIVTDAEDGVAFSITAQASDAAPKGWSLPKAGG